MSLSKETSAVRPREERGYTITKIKSAVSITITIKDGKASNHTEKFKRLNSQ